MDLTQQPTEPPSASVQRDVVFTERTLLYFCFFITSHVIVFLVLIIPTDTKPMAGKYYGINIAKQEQAD
jgi:hypothetical protein